MIITPAYAQAATGGGVNPFLEIVPMLLLIGLIMYFLVYRPQKRQMKERQDMLSAIRRNDTVVTAGGLVGKVTKVVDDTELEVQIAPDTRVRVARSYVAEVRVKGEPVKDAPQSAAKDEPADTADADAEAKPAAKTRRRRKN